MSSKYPRKPLGNFFVKKDLQIRLITKIVVSVLLATIVFAATLLITYNFTYQTAAFYQVSLGKNAPEIGDRLQIVSIILPSMLISAVVNLIFAFFIGLYASRKYAVPIYKLEKWASLLHEGKLSAKLQFREQDEMRDLSTKCNESSQMILNKFREIKKQVKELESAEKTEEPLKKILDILDTLELDSEDIDVKTARFFPHRNS